MSKITNKILQRLSQLCLYLSNFPEPSKRLAWLKLTQSTRQRSDRRLWAVVVFRVQRVSGIVQNDDHVSVQVTGVTHCLVGLARHSSRVANNRNHTFSLSFQVPCYCHPWEKKTRRISALIGLFESFKIMQEWNGKNNTKPGRNTVATVPWTERIVFALGSCHKPRKTVLSLSCLDKWSPSRENFMCICLAIKNLHMYQIDIIYIVLTPTGSLDLVNPRFNSPLNASWIQSGLSLTQTPQL